MKIHVLSIPLAQSMNGEGVTKIIRAWSDATLFRLQIGRFKQTTEGATRGCDWKSTPVSTHKKTRFWV
jgi:hypothetical protein